MEKHKVIIIGSGPAGYTAAIYAARADLKPLVFAGENFGGQLMNTTLVENWPGVRDGIMGPELMAQMRAQAEKFGAEIIDKNVSAVELRQRPFKVWAKLPSTGEGEWATKSDRETVKRLVEEVKTSEPEYEAESLIIATGAFAKMLDVPGEGKLFGRGVATCAVCDAPFYRGKKVFVVGGGDAAVEDTLALTKFAEEVTMVVRRDELRASKIMAERVKSHAKVKIKWNSRVVEVLGETKVEGVRLESETGVEELEADGVFLAIGHKPMTQIFGDDLEIDQQGYLVTRLGLSQMGVSLAETHINQGLVAFPTMTSVEGVFGAGDVVDFRYRQAVTAAAMGCQAALDAERWLAAKK